MKMKLLAIAVMATACGSSAFAAEIYNRGNTTLSIGGYVDVGVGEYASSDEVEVHSVSPRINVSGTQDLGNGMTVDAKGEWSLNYLDGGEQSFSTRLGYIGATHDQYGRLVVGTQWSPYYDVVGVTDLPIAFANDFIFDDDYYFLGTSRAEKMVSYRNSLSLGDIGDLSFGLGWQGNHTEEEGDPATPVEYHSRTQATLRFSIDMVTFGYAYNGGDVTRTEKVDQQSHAVSISAGEYGSGFYGAAVYAMNDYMNSGIEDTDAFELLLAYGLGYGMNVIGNYEEVVDSDSENTQYSHAALQLEYTFTPKFMGFAGYQFDAGNDIGEKEEDFWTVGARYFL